MRIGRVERIVQMVRKNFFRWLACATLFLLCLMPEALLAQQGKGVLTGTVTDSSTKQPLVDVVVTATSPALQGEQTVVTDASGLFRIPDLPPGVYRLAYDKEKYKPQAREAISLRSDTTLRVNAELLPEALKAEEVTVVARPPTVDVGSSSTGMNISQDFAHRVPLSRPGAKGSSNRSFESLAEAVPGASADRFGVSINGTTSPENSYVIDGTTVNNTATGTLGSAMTSEFIKETNVITAGYMPEYGRATGGILNVVTKSGSNEFHGGVFGSYSPGALEGTRKTVRKEGQAVLTTQQLGYIADIGADVGGPIKKDKLWFYFGLQYARQRIGLGRQLARINLYDATMLVPVRDASTGGVASTEAVPDSYRAYAAEQQQYQAFGKLTYLINADNNLALSILAAPQRSGGNGRYSIDPQTGLAEVDPVFGDGINGSYSSLGHYRTYDAYNTSLKWSSAFNNKRILLDTTLGFNHQDTALLPVDKSEPGSGQGLAGQSHILWQRVAAPNYHDITEFTGPQWDPDGANIVPAGFCDPAAVGASAAARPAPCSVRVYHTGGPGFIQRQNLDRYQLRSIATFIFQGAGHHIVKAGIDLEATRYRSLKAYSGGVYYRENPGGARFEDFRGYGYLTAGDVPVRLDSLDKTTKAYTAGGFVQDSWSILDKLTLNVGVRYDAQFLYNDLGQRALSLPNEWSPRVGLIYDPTQSGRAKIFANFARSYESVPLDLADRALSREPSISAWHPAGGNLGVGSGSNPNVPCRGTGPTAGAQMGPCLDPSLLIDRSARGSDLQAPDPNTKWRASGAGGEPIDPDIKPQSTDAIVAGAEYEVIKDGRVGLTYTKMWMNHVIEDMSRDEAITFFLGNPGEGMAHDFPKAVRNYDAVTLHFTKVFTDEWLVQASYTWSYLRGNYAGLFRPETGQLDPNINSDFDLTSLMPNRTGPLPGDRTHQIKVFAAKDWVISSEHHVRTGLGANAHSGEPTNALGAHDLYGTDEVFILQRGSQARLPWNYAADLQLGYSYNFDKDKTISVSIDVFNLFNFQGTTQIDQTYTRNAVLPVDGATKINPNGTITGLRNSDGTIFGDRRDLMLNCTVANEVPKPECPINPNYRNPSQYQPPRVFRFGVRATF
jgi:outer membrane receptor protein involved in Fe transport